MVESTVLKEQIANVLDGTEFDFLGTRYEGKVRDSYVQGDKRFLITTDRLSCFDRVVTSVPFKGQVLTDLAMYWFELTNGIVSNHVIDRPDPNVIVGKECSVLPVEVVVRGYLTGSAWRDYQAGKDISGVTLPAGLKNSEEFPEPILTPSTKAEKGEHDMPISEDQILSSGLVDKKIWQEVREMALEVFKLGSNVAAQQGLILVDTKYEFGLDGDKPILVDEIHTLDSSRFWVAESYQQRFEAGEAPQMLDKEPVRQWLLEQGFKGDGEIPEFSEQYRVEIAQHYVDSYSKITGKPFEPVAGNTLDRVEASLRKYAGN